MSNTTPSHKVLFAQPIGEKTLWTKVGATWITKKGNMMRLQLDLIPNTEGELYLAPWEDEESKQEADS